MAVSNMEFIICPPTSDKPYSPSGMLFFSKTPILATASLSVSISLLKGLCGHFSQFSPGYLSDG